MKSSIKLSLALAALLTSLVGCDGGDGAEAEGSEVTEETAAAPTNRIDVPPTVRQNLGITFAKVERRRVASTIRVPGRFELLPTARREHRATMAGRVTLLVGQYDEVEAGTELYRMESPQWHELRQELHETAAAAETAAADLAVAERAKAEAERAVERIERRIAELASAEVRRADLDADLAARQESLPRLEAEIAAKQVQLEQARRGLPIALASAASLLGVTRAHLEEPVQTPDGPAPRWRTIDAVTYSAAAAGVVETLAVADGTWVEQGALVMSVVDPSAVRFRATGLQSDLARLQDGLPATIVAPRQGAGGGKVDGGADALTGVLKVGLAGDPDERTIELFVSPEEAAPWAKPGVSAFLEIVAAGGDSELAIPVASVVRDELTDIFFRRDPKDPDKVIRVEADLGVSDGRWVVVNSGARAGDEVVLEGVYELKLSGAGKVAGGARGHFHADGTWHAEDD